MSTKRKHSPAEPVWRILLDDASGLRSVLDAVQAVTQRVIFKVSRTEGDRYVLMFDGADPGMTCCVSARLNVDQVVLRGDATQDTEEFQFCVDCRHLQVALDTPSCSHGSLLIEYHDDATIHCRMQDPEQMSHSDEAVLNTYVESENPIRLNDLDFNMKLEIDLSKLREMIKKATKTHAEHIRIQIFLRNNGAKQQSLVIFSVNGDSYHCQKFAHDTSKDEDGSLRVRAVADGESMICDTEDTPEYEAVFPVEKINAFVKILPCRMIVATLMTGFPLLMTHTLGGGLTGSSAHDDSHVRFLIAPINETD